MKTQKCTHCNGSGLFPCDVCHGTGSFPSEAVSKVEGEYDSRKCETGCRHLSGGEVRHHPDCIYYPESLSKMIDDMMQERSVPVIPATQGER